MVNPIDISKLAIFKPVLTEKGWVTPLFEIEKAAAIAAKYGVDIYAPHTDDNGLDCPVIVLRDFNAFKALTPDGKSIDDYGSTYYDGVSKFHKIYGGWLYQYNADAGTEEHQTLLAEVREYRKKFKLKEEYDWYED